MTAVAHLWRVWRQPWNWRRPFAARPWRLEVVAFLGWQKPIHAYSEHPSRAAAEIAARASMRIT